MIGRSGRASRGESRWPGALTFVAIALALGVAGAFAVVTLPAKVGFAFAAAIVPVTAIAMIVLRSPYVGLLLIFVLEYFRPQDHIKALMPLRLPFLATVGMFFVLVITIIRDPKRGVVWPREAWTLAVLVAFMALSVITSVNNFYAYHFFRGMVLTMITFLLTVNLVDSQRRLRTLIVLLVFAHVFLCFKGIQQFVSGNKFGTTGSVGGNFLGDENDFAMALIVIFPFIYFAIEAARRGRKFLWGAAALLVLTTIMLTMSRGGFVGIAVTLFYCWLRSRRKFASALGVVFLIAIVAAVAPSSYFDEIKSIKNTDEGTAHKRREYWLAGMRMFAEKPLIGVGPGNSPLYMPQYLDLPNPNTQWGRAMHGTFPLLAAEMGGVGIIVYVILFLQCAGDLRRMRRAKARDPDEATFLHYFANATAASMIGFLTAATFLSALYYPHIYVLAAFCAVGRRLALRASVEAAP